MLSSPFFDPPMKGYYSSGPFLLFHDFTPASKIDVAHNITIHVLPFGPLYAFYKMLAYKKGAGWEEKLIAPVLIPFPILHMLSTASQIALSSISDLSTSIPSSSSSLYVHSHDSHPVQ